MSFSVENPFSFKDIEKIKDYLDISEFLDKGYKVLSVVPVKYNSNDEIVVFLYNKSDIISLRFDYKKEYYSLVNNYPQMHLFERELYENKSINFKNHPILNPVRYINNQNVGDGKFISIDSSQTHEVAVGPVHAGIIEPGHFRFQCYGEKVFYLQIELGYQHRGIEKNFIGGPDKKTINYMEVVAGDSSVAHSIAYCENIEKLCSVKPSDRALYIRTIMLELERMANHIGDLGALSNDVAYLPTAAYCGRIRGEVLNTTAIICGNRFGRNIIEPGGVRFDIDDNIIKIIDKRLDNIYDDVLNALELLFNKSSVIDRFKNTGIVSKEVADKLGLVGPCARASGINNDVRELFPNIVYTKLNFKSHVLDSGDVWARAYIRYIEIKESYKIIKYLLSNIPKGDIQTDFNYSYIKRNSFSISLVEAWRGLVCHTVFINEEGKISQYKIVDPSFHNWQGLAMALRNEEISNFPLCNKSFNLSYCGHDL